MVEFDKEKEQKRLERATTAMYPTKSEAPTEQTMMQVRNIKGTLRVNRKDGNVRFTTLFLKALVVSLQKLFAHFYCWKTEFIRIKSFKPRRTIFSSTLLIRWRFQGYCCKSGHFKLRFNCLQRFRQLWKLCINFLDRVNFEKSFNITHHFNFFVILDK